MEKILITGGTGFLGYHLFDYLLRKKKYKIHIVDNLSRGKLDREFKNLLQNRRARFVNADLTDHRSFYLLKDSYAYIYHLAAIVGVRNVVSSPDKTLFVNTVGTLNLLEWIKRTQKALKRIVFASTSEVYAGTAKHYGVVVPTDENVNICLDNIRYPRTTYALSKIVGESACFNYSVPFTIVRYHNVYGPRMGYDHVIPELMLKAKNAKRNLGVYSPGHTRAFCYVLDAVRATVDLAETGEATNQIFNIGNDAEEITMRMLAKKIINAVNPGLKIISLGNQRGSPSRRCPNIRKLKRMIKFQPQVSLDEGIRLILEMI
jgi:UDP-glucose 4-epimerase